MAKDLVIKCDTCKKEVEPKDGQISIIVGDDSIQCEPCNDEENAMVSRLMAIQLAQQFYNPEAIEHLRKIATKRAKEIIAERKLQKEFASDCDYF